MLKKLGVSPFRQVEDRLVMLPGVIGIGEDGKLVNGPMAELDQAYEHLKSLLLMGYGLTFNNIVRIRIYVVGLNRFSELVNNNYLKHFADVLAEHRVPPVRTVIGVTELPLGARFELEVDADRGR